MKFHFELTARGIHYRAGTIPAVAAKSRVLRKFLFRDAFLANIGAWPTLHHGFYAGALLRRHLGERVGRDVWRGWHPSHGMSHGHFPETLLDVEGRDIVGGPEGERAEDDWGKKKLVSHQHSPGVIYLVI